MDYFEILLLILGLYTLAPFVMSFLSLLKLTVLQGLKPKDILTSYTHDRTPWALVTGCTSGIGEELAHQLASKGFNIVLVSRSMERLLKVQQSITASFPERETIILQVDLCKMATDIKTYTEVIAK